MTHQPGEDMMMVSGAALDAAIGPRANGRERAAIQSADLLEFLTTLTRWTQ